MRGFVNWLKNLLYRLMEWISEDSSKQSQQNTSHAADTFVEATGGGWDEMPDKVSNQDDYVRGLLEQARDQALRSGVKVGEEFDFTITNIPGITHPNEVIFPIVLLQSDYGLMMVYSADETVRFKRTK